MDKIEFINPILYSPELASIPLEYAGSDFSNIDFTGKEKLKEFLVEYFKNMSCVKDGISYDSLLFCRSEASFQLMVAAYKEVASRVTADSYKFFDWPTYSAQLRGLGFKSDNQIVKDLFDTRFAFVFDLVFHHKDSIDYFCSLLDNCYSNRIKLFICTRNESIMESLPAEFLNIIKQKIFTVKIKD